MKIFVGNLARSADETALLELFSQWGDVDSVRVIRDLETQDSLGYAFLVMPHTKDALLAIQSADGCEFQGRVLKVAAANGRR